MYELGTSKSPHWYTDRRWYTRLKVSNNLTQRNLIHFVTCHYCHYYSTVIPELDIKLIRCNFLIHESYSFCFRFVFSQHLPIAPHLPAQVGSTMSGKCNYPQVHQTVGEITGSILPEQLGILDIVIYNSHRESTLLNLDFMSNFKLLLTPHSMKTSAHDSRVIYTRFSFIVCSFVLLKTLWHSASAPYTIQFLLLAAIIGPTSSYRSIIECR